MTQAWTDVSAERRRRRRRRYLACCFQGGHELSVEAVECSCRGTTGPRLPRAVGTRRWIAASSFSHVAGEPARKTRDHSRCRQDRLAASVRFN